MPMLNVVSMNSVSEALEEQSPPSSAPAASASPEQWSALLSRSQTPSYQITSSLDPIEDCRTQLCEWAYTLVDHYSIDRTIVSIAFSLFDRYVSLNGTKVELELVALACVFTAVKVHSNNGKLTSRACAKLSRSSAGERRFTPQQIEDMEYEICSSLHWHVNPPIPAMFLEVAFDHIEAHTKDLPCLDSVKDLSTFLVEISIADSYFVTASPSSIACAALLVAAELSPSRPLRRFIKSLRDDPQETQGCATRLYQHYENWSCRENEKAARVRERSPCASPTAVDLENSRVAPLDLEGSRLESAFEEVGDEMSSDWCGKRKRDLV